MGHRFKTPRNDNDMLDYVLGGVGRFNSRYPRVRSSKMVGVSKGGPLYGLIGVLDPARAFVSSTAVVSATSMMGNGMCISQDAGGASNYPTYLASAWNGNPGIQFSRAASEQLGFGNGSGDVYPFMGGAADEQTMVAVWRSDQSSQQYRVLGLADASTDAQFFFRVNSNGSVQAFGQGSGEATSVDTGAGAVHSGDIGIAAARLNAVPGRVEIAINSTTWNATDNGSAFVVTSHWHTYGKIMHFNNLQQANATFLYGLLFNKAISDAQWTSLHSYLSGRFGI